MTDLSTLPTSPDTDHDDELTHLVCCDLDTALCGSNVHGDCWVPQSDEENLCLVCADLDHTYDCCRLIPWKP